MLSNIKLWLYGAVVAVIAFLSLSVKWQSHKRKQAEETAKNERKRGDQYKDAQIENAKIIEGLKHDAKTRAEINNLSDDDLSARLSKYTRDDNHL